MKQFLKYVLATVVGLLVTGAVLTVAGLATLGSLVAVGSATTEVTDGAVLRLRLTGEVTERVTENPLNTLMGADAEATGLDELLAAIRIAADDDRIAGIYLEGGVLLASPATLEELRDALVAFKRSGKFVVAYGDNYSQGAYYVASVADRVVLNPSGMLDWHGFAATPVFYKDLLEKVGVRMQVYRVGTYKSYVEPYTLTAMSEASRKQIDAYLRDIWSRICHEVAASRRVKVDSLNAYADRYTLLADARDYVRQGLVDTLAYVDGVRALLRQRVGTDKLTFVAPRDVVASVHLMNSPSAIGLPVCWFHGFLWSLLYLAWARRCISASNAFLISALSFSDVVSLKASYSFWRTSAFFFALSSARAFSLGSTKVRYSQRAKPQMSTAGSSTANRKYFGRKNLRPFVNSEYV